MSLLFEVFFIFFLVFAVFVQHCNNHPMGLTFSHVWDPDYLVFVDLEFNHEDNRTVSKALFKPSSWNSFLHFRCCHNSNWIRKISQKLIMLSKTKMHQRFWLFCPEEEYDRFVEKGYDPTHIHIAQQECLHIPLQQGLINLLGI